MHGGVNRQQICFRMLYLSILIALTLSITLSCSHGTFYLFVYAIQQPINNVKGSITYNTYLNGSVLVTVIVSLHGELRVSLPLEGQVKPGSIIVLDEHGLPLPYDQNKTTITIYSLNATKITLIYMTQKLVTFTNGIWSLHVKPFLPPTIILPENSILLKYTGNPQIRAENGRIILRYNVRGDYEVYFTSAIPVTLTESMRPRTTPTTLITVANTTTTPTITHVTSTVEPERDLLKDLFLPLIILLMLPPIAAIIYYYFKQKTTTTIVISESFLDERDKEILKIVESRETITLSELTKTLNISKSTVWRRVQKLQKLGYIDVERVAGKLVIKAKKKD